MIPSRRLLAIAMLSASVMLFEILLTRVLSFSIWHHFASMVLSLALLGFSVAGVAVQCRPSLTRYAEAGALGFGLTAPLTTWIVACIPFDPTQLATAPQQFLLIVLDYALLAVPFGLAGLALVSWLQAALPRIGLAYGVDLCGAAVGGLGALVALNTLGMESLLWGVAVLGGVSAWLARPRPLALALAAGFLLMGAVSPWLGHLPPGPSKALARLTDPVRHPEARLLSSRWHAVGRVDVVDRTAPISWLVTKDGATVPEIQLLIDGDAGTPILDLTGNPSLAFLRSTVSAAGYQIFHPQHSLIIGSGGGVDVLTALECGVRKVDAVEVNPLIHRLVTDTYVLQLDQLFEKPGVYLHLAEGRSFIHRSEEKYDSVQLSLIDTWAATASGAHSLAEAYLYTVEAFQDYLSHLNDGGVLTVTRWYEIPPREPLKLCTTAMAALRNLGQNEPEKCIAVVGSQGTANVMISRTPLSTLTIKGIALLCSMRGLDVLYLPGVALKNDFTRVLSGSTAGQREVYDYSPATDDRPFFFQFGRWSDASPLGSGWQDHPSVLSGRLVLLAIFLQALPLALGLLALPRLVGSSKAASWSTLGHFGALGVGFMLVEMALVQQFTLYLGHPVYSVASVISAMLFWAGLGSLTCTPSARGWHRNSYILILVLLVIYAECLSGLLWGSFNWPWLARLGITWLVLAPLGLMLGRPMPSSLGNLAPGEFAWAWAANGCGSVLGPILASLWALDWGFTSLLWIAAFVYLAAAATCPKQA